MKLKPFLLSLALICLITSSLGLTALHIHKKRVASTEQLQEKNNNTDSKKTQNEVMLWESLSRHLLSFN